jgi:hypothetical protein
MDFALIRSRFPENPRDKNESSRVPGSRRDDDRGKALSP